MTGMTTSATTTRSATRCAMIPESRSPDTRSPDTRDTSVPDVVHVWLVPTDQPPTVLAQLAAHLDDEERRRAASHHSAVQRARFVAAHGATRRIVAARLGIDPGEFTWRRGEHGKPEPDVAGVSVRISLSTSAEVALVAVGTSLTPSSPLREVGIDIERLISDHEATRLAARFFPPDQAAYVAEGREHGGAAERFATLWCRKEACVKALGGRLVQGLGLSVQGDAPLVTDFPSSPDAEYRVCDVPAPRHFRAAVALSGAAPYQLRCRIWSPFH